MLVKRYFDYHGKTSGTGESYGVISRECDVHQNGLESEYIFLFVVVLFIGVFCEQWPNFNRHSLWGASENPRFIKGKNQVTPVQVKNLKILVSFENGDVNKSNLNFLLMSNKI